MGFAGGVYINFGNRLFPGDRQPTFPMILPVILVLLDFLSCVPSVFLTIKEASNSLY